MEKFKRMLPHVAILICNMYIVFFLIDRVNPAMNFIDNRLTKGLLWTFSLLTLLDALLIMAAVISGRLRTGKKKHKHPSRREE